ncbi:MAG: gluconokinase, GntK/IdnK-type [Colwellia sp.]
MSELLQPSLRLFIIMGVSGTGKSSVAEKMADDLSYIFVDADDFHCAEAKKCMAENIPLTDEMRIPWLTAVIKYLHSLYQQGKSVMLAYSGLKLAHRDLFRQLPFHCHFFYLTASKALIAERMAKRENHFFSPLLLASQFEAMEAPLLDECDVTVVTIEKPLLQVVNEITALANQIIRTSHHA